MYSTKELNKNIAKSYLSQGDPYREPGEVKHSRHKGKQFVTQPSKLTCDGGGYFQRQNYASDPLLDNTMYSKTQPTRKLGFGTHDASRRDEFMSHIRTEQYRETLAREMKIIEQQKENNHAENQELKEFIKSQSEKHTFPEGLKETKYLYDIGRENETEFNQKSHRDTFYTMRTGNSKYKRNNGHFHLSSQSIGDGVNEVEYKPANARLATTKQFYDKSHLQV